MLGVSSVSARAFVVSGSRRPQPALRPGGHQFVLTAKTPKSWAGTTRTFTLKFNDQSVHTQVVKF